MARENELAHMAFMCDAKVDERAIREFFEVHQELNHRFFRDTKAVIALSVDALPSEGDMRSREQKSNASWKMLANKGEVIKDPENQNFRLGCTVLQ